jgi:hypothetical protein
MIANAKAYTFASRTSLDTIQSLQKSMLFQTLTENKKSSRHSKKREKLMFWNLCRLKWKKASW